MCYLKGLEDVKSLYRGNNYVQLGEDKMTTPYSRERRRRIEKAEEDMNQQRLERDREMFGDVEQ